MTQPVDRERVALQAILEALLPQLLYFCVWSYRVTGAEGTGPVTISAKSQDPRLPDQQRIVLRPGPDGGYSTPPNGSEVAIGFLNGDPERPYVHSLDPTATSGTSWQHATTLVELGSAMAVALAHAPNTSTSLTAIVTWLTAVNVWLNAAIVVNVGVFTDPGATLTSTLVAATTAAIAAINAQLPTLPTTIVKGA